MQISEVVLTVGKSGGLLIPPELLTEMGLGPDALIHIAYLTQNGKENTFQELFLSSDGLERMEDDEAIQVPNTLLEKAGLGDGDDLKILCMNGCILICRDTEFRAEDLHEIFEHLGRAEALSSALSFNAPEVKDQLAAFIKYFEGGSEDRL